MLDSLVVVPLRTVNVILLEILLSEFPVLFFTSFGSSELLAREFVSDFGFRASDWVAAMSLCVLYERS